MYQLNYYFVHGSDIVVPIAGSLKVLNTVTKKWVAVPVARGPKILPLVVPVVVLKKAANVFWTSVDAIILVQVICIVSLTKSNVKNFCCI